MAVILRQEPDLIRPKTLSEKEKRKRIVYLMK